MPDKSQTVMHDLRFSLKQVEKARPIIKKLLKGGEIKAVEGRDDEICLMLDQNCGTDYFQIYGNGEKLNGVVWGVGSRFQSVWHGGKTFDTFTIRLARESGADTEYKKRKLAIERNGIYPFLTMHGYYDEKTGEILSLAIARTKDIWDCIEKGHCDTKKTGQGQVGQATFYVVGWEKFKSLGYPIEIWRMGDV